jgi:hypothetical protein
MDVTPVLKWVKEDQEKQIRKAFQDTLAVSAKGEEVKKLANMYSFETLVGFHHASESAPYTDLNPAGTRPGSVAADEALEKDDMDTLIKKIDAHVAEGICNAFQDYAGDVRSCGRQRQCRPDDRDGLHSLHTLRSRRHPGRGWR